MPNKLRLHAISQLAFLLLKLIMNVYKCFQIVRVFETRLLLALNMRRILSFCNLLTINRL
jgi:hypothetical protein